LHHQPAHPTFGHTLTATALSVDDYGYFSSVNLSNWTGASHWKPSTLKPRIDQLDSLNDAKNARKLQLKDKSFIDFSIEIDWKTKFAVGRAATTLKSETAKKNGFALPDDLHYSGNDLLKLFCKPKMKVTAIV
jgi:hypothetical protein